jgi:N-methylhydantoinase B
VRNVPVESTEAIAPIVVWRKDFRTDSGGPGRWRGGLGQVMEVESRSHTPLGLHAVFERVRHPARGREGGGAGATGRVRLASGADLKAKGFQVVPAGERLVVEMPGGGGYGDPRTRDPRRVALDVRRGLVTAEAARRDYGVALSEAGDVDEAETGRLRAGG